MKKPAIIVDLDGTLADSGHRLHYIKDKRTKNFHKFHSECVNDKPNIWCTEIVTRFYSAGHSIVFLTGRNEEYRKITHKWLIDTFAARGVPLLFELYMRPDGDYRKDTVTKLEIYQRDIEPQYSVLFAIDDRLQVAQMWRKAGITCLHCAEGDF